MGRLKKEIIFYKDGINLFNEAKYEDALNYFDKAIERNSRFLKAWIFKGLTLAALSRYEESIVCYDTAIEIRSRNSWPWQNKGWSLVRLEKYDAALEALNKAIEIAPRNSNAWSIKGDCLLALENYEEAKTCYDKAIEINPKNEFHWNGKGSCLLELGMFEEAADCFNRGLELNNENSDLWYHKGLGLYKQNKYSSAIQSFNKAIELNPNDLEALYYKGSMLKELNKTDDANECFRKINELDTLFLDQIRKNGTKEEKIEDADITKCNYVSHEEIQWMLLKLGCKMDLSVWVAKNDKNKEVNGNCFKNIPRLVEELPVQFDEKTNKTIELIDVIWLRGNAIVAAFEIESTTTIYSGLLRMSDLISMQPNLNIDLYIVAPDDRREKVIMEINRPTFSKLTPPVSVICRYIPFSKLKERIQLHHDVIHHLKPSFLTEISESCQLEEMDKLDPDRFV